MSLSAVLKSVLRRWYITVPALILAAAMCFVVYQKSTPVYERTASEILIPGKASVPVGGNPYYYLGGLSQASDVLVRSLNSKTVTGAILADHPGVSAVVARDLSTSGPMLTVTVDGPDDKDVATVLTKVIAAIPTTLGSLQDAANVPPEARIGTLTLTQDTSPKLIQKSRLTTLGFVAVGSVAGIVIVVGLLDGLLVAWARRRAERAEVQAELEAAGSLPAENRRTVGKARVHRSRTDDIGPEDRGDHDVHSEDEDRP